MPSCRTSYSCRFLQWLVHRREQQTIRHAFEYLLGLDDDLLEDIGVSRAELERTAGLTPRKTTAQLLDESVQRSRSNRT